MQTDNYPTFTKRSAVAPTVEVYQALQQAYQHFNENLFDGQLPNCLISLQRTKKSRGYYSPQRFAKGDKTVGEIQYSDELALNPEYFGVRTIEQTLSTLVHEMCHVWQGHVGTPCRLSYHDREWSKKMLSVGLQPSDTGQPGGKPTGQKMGHFILPGGRFEEATKTLLTQEWTLDWYDRYPAQSIVTSALRTNMAIQQPTCPNDPDAMPDGSQGAGRAIEFGARPTAQVSFTGPNKLPRQTAVEPRVKNCAYDSSRRVKYSCAGGCKSSVWGKASLKIMCMTCNLAFMPVVADGPEPSTLHHAH